MKEGLDVEGVLGYLLEELEEGHRVREAEEEALVQPQDAQAHSEQNFGALQQEAVQDAQDGLGAEPTQSVLRQSIICHRILEKGQLEGNFDVLLVVSKLFWGVSSCLHS